MFLRGVKKPCDFPPCKSPLFRPFAVANIDVKKLLFLDTSQTIEGFFETGLWKYGQPNKSHDGLAWQALHAVDRLRQRLVPSQLTRFRSTRLL